jgi:hypothetical protein
LVYALALFSIKQMQQMLGRIGWLLLRTVAMNYIAYAFAVDFLRAPLGGTIHTAEYLPFAALSIAGPIFYAISLLPSIGRFGKGSS